MTWRRVAIAIFALAAIPACRKPEDVLGWSCKSNALSIINECSVSAARLPNEQSVYIDPGTSNFKVQVSATITIAKGRVSVVIPGCAENGSAQAAAGAPATLKCDARIDRGSRKLEVRATPQEGEAGGFEIALALRPL